jgi:hypothetical protein
VVDDVADSVRVEPGIDRVQNRACHRNGEMTLEHFRGIEGKYRDRIVFTDATRRQTGGNSYTAVAGLRPGIAALVINQGFALRIDIGGSMQE